MRTFEVMVPKADEYQIDDFLGNILMYKIENDWKYLHNIELPVNELKIIEFKNLENESCLTIQIL
jgi:hypothetical protein